jgi:hypothetical protein
MFQELDEIVPSQSRPDLVEAIAELSEQETILLERALMKLVLSRTNCGCDRRRTDSATRFWIEHRWPARIPCFEGIGCGLNLSTVRS